MEGLVKVKVASSLPLHLYSDRLCARSGYFRAALQGGFAESEERSLEIPWTGSIANCELFLCWLALESPESCFNSSCALQFLACCAYFQVSEDYWHLVDTQVVLPASYNQSTEELKTVWVRQTVPFSVMKRIVQQVGNKLERLGFMFAWFNEKTATSPSDKRALETCEDFFQMRDLAAAVFLPVQPLPASTMWSTGPIQPAAVTGSSKPGVMPQERYSGFGGGFTAPVASTTFQASTSVLERFAQFPIAANSLETVWLLRRLSNGDFQGL